MAERVHRAHAADEDDRRHADARDRVQNRRRHRIRHADGDDLWRRQSRLVRDLHQRARGLAARRVRIRRRHDDERHDDHGAVIGRHTICRWLRHPLDRDARSQRRRGHLHWACSDDFRTGRCKQQRLRVHLLRVLESGDGREPEFAQRLVELVRHRQAGRGDRAQAGRRRGHHARARARRPGGAMSRQPRRLRSPELPRPQPLAASGPRLHARSPARQPRQPPAAQASAYRLR